MRAWAARPLPFMYVDGFSTQSLRSLTAMVARWPWKRASLWKLPPNFDASASAYQKPALWRVRA